MEEEIKELRERIHNLDTSYAISMKALESLDEMISILNNHYETLRSQTNSLCKDIEVIKLKIDAFLNVFKWLFPSFLILISMVAGLSLMLVR